MIVERVHGAGPEREDLALTFQHIVGIAVATLRLANREKELQMTGTIERLNFPQLVEAGDAPFCSIVQDGHYAYLAGIVAADFPGGRATLGDVAAETTAVMQAVRQLLAEVGLSMSDIVRCDVHLTDLTDMPAMNTA